MDILLKKKKKEKSKAFGALTEFKTSSIPIEQTNTPNVLNCIELKYI